MLFKKTFPLLAFCSFVSSPVLTMHSHATESESVSLRFSESVRFSNLLDQYFDHLQQIFPEFSTYIGFKKDFNGNWTDHSEKGYALRQEEVKKNLDRLSSIDRQKLSIPEQLNYDLFEKELVTSLKSYELELHYMPLDQLGGIPLDVENILMMMPKETSDDYHRILVRLSKIPELINQTIDLLLTGIEKKMTPPQVVLRSVPKSISKMIPSHFEKSVFFQPFAIFPETIDLPEQKILVEKALKLIQEIVYPSYEKLQNFLSEVYLPACRKSIGAKDLPNGETIYQYYVERHTTTQLTPKEIHHIGLKEVERIHGEMQKILDEIEYQGSISEFFEYLNCDPEFFYTEPEDLLDGYREITSYINGQLPILFGRLPKLSYEVLPVPAFSEESQVGAYYVRGSLATGRPGRFYANTFDMGSRPKWQMESLALHEAVPGHHFQISLAQEIVGLPEFRKYNGYTAYIEGWGLYSEGLGTELGLYLTPTSQFGRLIEEVWRAVRLVVDTGIHSLGWSREESIAYMREKTGMGKREVTTEIDRYIVWPGQALAYKIGELSIQRWRCEAKEVLGDAFDIRSFHDMLLEQGALPLDICEEQVYQWIKAQTEVVIP